VTLEAEIMSSRRTNIIFPHGSSSNARVLDTVAKSPRIHGARVFIVSGASGVYSGRLLDSMDYLGSNIFREMLRVWAVVPDYPAGRWPYSIISLVLADESD
jgi:hypothetical protein